MTHDARIQATQNQIIGYCAIGGAWIGGALASSGIVSTGLGVAAGTYLGTGLGYIPSSIYGYFASKPKPSIININADKAITVIQPTLDKVNNTADIASKLLNSSRSKCSGGISMGAGFVGAVMSGAIYKGIEFLNLRADYEKGEQMESAVKTCSLVMLMIGMGAIGLGLVRSVR